MRRMVLGGSVASITLAESGEAARDLAQHASPVLKSSRQVVHTGSPSAAGTAPDGPGAHRPPDPVHYLAAAAFLARCRVVVLTSASRSPLLIPARYATSFFRASISYCVVMAICSMIGDPPPW